MNLYQHAKNQTSSSFYSREIVNLKTLQSEWPRTLWHISQKPKFSKIFPNMQQLIQTSIIEQIEKKMAMFSYAFKES